MSSFPLLMYWLLNILSGKNVSDFLRTKPVMEQQSHQESLQKNSYAYVATLSFRENHSPINQRFLFTYRTQGFHALKKISCQQALKHKSPHGASLIFPLRTPERLLTFLPATAGDKWFSCEVCVSLSLFLLLLLSFPWLMPLGSFTPYFTLVPKTHSPLHHSFSGKISRNMGEQRTNLPSY